MPLATTVMKFSRSSLKSTLQTHVRVSRIGTIVTDLSFHLESMRSRMRSVRLTVVTPHHCDELVSIRRKLCKAPRQRTSAVLMMRHTVRSSFSANFRGPMGVTQLHKTKGTHPLQA